MRAKHLTTGIGVAMLAAVAAFAERGVSERYAFETYRERVGSVTVLVDSYPACLRHESAYIPLRVAVGLKGGAPEVIVTRETFTLIDAAGNRAPAVGPMEIRENYGMVTFDEFLMRIRPLVVGTQFTGSQRLRSSFYGDGEAIGLVQNAVHMGPYTWFQDFAYFPRPPAGLGGVLKLRVEGGGLEEPIEVRFRILERKAGT